MSELSGVTTQVTPSIYEQTLNIDDWFGWFADEYDIEAVRQDVLRLTNERLPEGVTLYIDGSVIADVAVLDQLADIEWGELVNSDELPAIAEQHLRKEFR